MAFVGAFAGVEAVDEREGEAAAVVALALVDGDAEGAHRPVVVAGVEQVRGRESETERLFQERFFDREVHTAQRRAETVGVHVTAAAPVYIGCYGPVAGQ